MGRRDGNLSDGTYVEIEGNGHNRGSRGTVVGYRKSWIGSSGQYKVQLGEGCVFVFYWRLRSVSALEALAEAAEGID